MAARLGGQSCAGLVLRYTGWCQDEWTSSTGNLNRKRIDISETLLKSVSNTKQSFNWVLFHSPAECLLFHGDNKRLLERVNTAQHIPKLCTKHTLLACIVDYEQALCLYESR